MANLMELVKKEDGSSSLVVVKDLSAKQDENAPIDRNNPPLDEVTQRKIGRLKKEFLLKEMSKELYWSLSNPRNPTKKEIEEVKNALSCLVEVFQNPSDGLGFYLCEIYEQEISLKNCVGNLCETIASDKISIKKKTDLVEAINSVLNKKAEDKIFDEDIEISKHILVESICELYRAFSNKKQKFLGDLERKMGENYPIEIKNISREHKNINFNEILWLENMDKALSRANPPQTKGRKGLSPHLRLATKILFSYWSKINKDEDLPSPYFLTPTKSERNFIEPKGFFTVWFCEIMQREFSCTLSECRTLLEPYKNREAVQRLIKREKCRILKPRIA